jgi:hypothetical protein
MICVSDSIEADAPNFMEQSPFREADSYSAIQQIMQSGGSMQSLQQATVRASPEPSEDSFHPQEVSVL